MARFLEIRSIHFLRVLAATTIILTIAKASERNRRQTKLTKVHVLHMAVGHRSALYMHDPYFFFYQELNKWNKQLNSKSLMRDGYDLVVGIYHSYRQGP